MAPDVITETAVVGLLVLAAAREAREWALLVSGRWKIVTAAETAREKAARTAGEPPPEVSAVAEEPATAVQDGKLPWRPADAA